MIYYVDFDNTICPGNGGPPQADCSKVLQYLKLCHNTICIYSCRSNPDTIDDPVRATREMEEYLKEHGIPYDTVVTGKPYFNFLIDDRSVGIPLTKEGDVDWSGVKEKLVPKQWR